MDLCCIICKTFPRAHRLSCCSRQAPEHPGSVAVAHGLSCSAACGILAPLPGIKPLYPALQGGLLTTGPPGMSLGSPQAQTQHNSLELYFVFCNHIHLTPKYSPADWTWYHGLGDHFPSFYRCLQELVLRKEVIEPWALSTLSNPPVCAKSVLSMPVPIFYHHPTTSKEI